MLLLFVQKLAALLQKTVKSKASLFKEANFCIEMALGGLFFA